MIQDCNSRTGEPIEAASGDACTRQRRRLSLAILWATVLVGVLAAAAPAWAHEFTLDAVMNAFVKIDPREAHLVIRVPLYAIKSAKFPVNGREIDVAAAEPAIQRALSLVGREITLEENGRPLRASAASGRLSLPSDRSFESYEAAVAHVAQPVGPDTVIYAD